ncbi:MAG: hypothetical protein ACOYYI_14725, partial [Chloroflexota bacterium]
MIPQASPFSFRDIHGFSGMTFVLIFPSLNPFSFRDIHGFSGMTFVLIFPSLNPNTTSCTSAANRLGMTSAD